MTAVDQLTLSPIKVCVPVQEHEFIELPRHEKIDRPRANEKFTKLANAMARYAKTPLLKQDEELQLIAKAQNGDAEARGALIRAYLKFIAGMVSRIATRTGNQHHAPDMVTVGINALARSIEKFDPEEHCRLSSYAKFHILGDCLYYLNRNAQMVALRTSFHQKKVYYMRHQIHEEFEAIHGRRLSLDPADLRYVTQKYDLSSTQSKSSLKAGLFPEMFGDIPLHHLDIQSQEPDPEAELYQKTSLTAVDEAIIYLKETLARERDFHIFMEYRHNPDICVFEQGKKYLITGERIRQIRRACLAIIRTFLRSKGISSLQDMI